MNRLPRLSPMTLSPRAHPFDDPALLFELKHDGFRTLAYVERGKCELVSRWRKVYKSFESLRNGISRLLRVDNAILDGEIVCLDASGHSLFKELLYRRGEPVLYVFDLLWLNGRDLRGLPLLERKRRLRRLIRPSHRSYLLYAEHVEGRGKDFYRAVCASNSEGMVAKRKAGTYSPARPGAWLKIKNPNYTQAEGRPEMFESFRTPRGRVKSSE